jgi:hypothetical protein
MQEIRVSKVLRCVSLLQKIGLKSCLYEDVAYKYGRFIKIEIKYV